MPEQKENKTTTLTEQQHTVCVKINQNETTTHSLCEDTKHNKNKATRSLCEDRKTENKIQFVRG